MSYILEALKKAEEKREREQEQRLFTFSDRPVPARKRRALWPYLIAVGLFLNAVAVILWIAPWRTEDHQSTSQMPALSQQASAGPAKSEGLEDGRLENPKGTLPAPAREASAPSAPATVGTPVASSGPATGEKAGPPLPAPTRKAPAIETLPAAPQASKQATRPTSSARDVPPGDKLLRLGELPSDIRSALPEFKISGHAYGPEPRTRVARVNETILQEGQALAPGLKLEEIVPTGLVFSYQGYRFLVNVEAKQ